MRTRLRSPPHHSLSLVLSSLPPLLSTAADGVYTGEYSTMAICGFVRSMAEADGAFDRLWTKCYDDAKGSI